MKRPARISTSLWKGETLDGRYFIGEKLGDGGMANVHRALDQRLGRDVAVKILRTDIDRRSDCGKRLLREAKCAAAVTHSSIIAIYDVGQSGDIVYVVMELLEGRPLDKLLREEEKLPPLFVMDAARQVSEGLTAIHKAGIVHRDIKPENLFVVHTNTGASIKLLDFSIAKLSADMETQQLTADGTIIGSAFYMAPEQVRAHPVTPRTDIYALGCVVYECIVGTPPFRAEALVDLWKQHIEAPIPTIAEAVVGVPEEFSDLVAQMKAKDPEDRPQSAAAVAHRLADLIEVGLDQGLTAKAKVRATSRTVQYSTGRDIQWQTTAARKTKPHRTPSGSRLPRQSVSESGKTTRKIRKT